jgi:DNA-directed RNA polymerase specialized sigma24 family protein
MAVQFRWNASQAEDVQEPVWADWGTFTDIFREYAEYVFEYCISLLSDEREAAGATTVTFITAQALLGCLENQDRLEPWLYALARRECTSKRPARWEKVPDGAGSGPVGAGRAQAGKPGTGNSQAANGSAGALGNGAAPGNGAAAGSGAEASNGPTANGAAANGGEAAGAAAAGLPVRDGERAGAESSGVDTDELKAITTHTSERRIAGRQALSAFSRLPEEDREVLAAFSALSSRDREVLDLVYWHGLSPVELPAILDIPAQRAQTLLASAVRRFRLAAENAEVTGEEAEGSGDKLAAAMPVARMPAAVWRRASRAVFDPELRSYRNAVLAHAGRLRPDGFPAQPAAPGARAQTVKVGAAILVPAAAGLALLMYVVGTSSGAPAGQIALTTPDAPTTAAGTHAAAAAGSRHGHAKAHHGALPITSLFPGQHTQGILPVPSPGTSTNGYTPAPNPSTASSAPRPSSKPSSIAPPPSHKASPSPTKTKASPTPTLSNPSPTPTSPSPSSSGTSSSAAATPTVTDSPTASTVQGAVSVALERLGPLSAIDRFLS